MDDRVDLEQFFARLAADTGTPALDEAEAAALLDLARVVAHTVERRFAPLTTYVAGLALDPSLPPTDRIERVHDLTEAVRRLAAGQPAGGDGTGAGA